MLLSELIWWPISLIPLIRLFVSERYTLLAISISFNREIISPYFCYIKKGLVYIIIADLFSRQPSSYTKHTKLNTRALCDIYLVSLNKCAFPGYTYCYTY